MVEQDFIVIEGREIHVRVWNRQATKTVLCWHGLARTGGDFLELGEALSQLGYRVLAPDTIGRGLSQWAETSDEYQIPNYLNHALQLLGHYNVSEFIWVGTSMGGLLGMVAASNALKDRIQKLVINDIGPEIPLDALERISEYVNDFPEFEKLSGFEHRIRELYAPFGQRSIQQWHVMAHQCSRRLANGSWVSHYDPNIGGQFDPSKGALTIWPVFESIECDLLLLRGEVSDVLPKSVAQKMQSLKPNLTYCEIPDCGHAPGLHLEQHLEPVVAFITA